jgi:hypothetical protein
MKVALCTPAYAGDEPLKRGRSMRALMSALEKRGDVVIEIDAARSANLPDTRNALAAMALAWGADVIFWIDSDIAFDWRDALKLIDRPEDIVGAAPQKRPKALYEAPETAWRPHRAGEVRITSEGLMDVGLVPTAFMKTTPRVYEALAACGIAKRLYRPNGELPEPAMAFYRNYFWYELTDIGERDPATGETLWRSDHEDTAFCRHAIACGLSTWLDPMVRLVHHAHNVEMTVTTWDLIGAEIEAHIAKRNEEAA